MTDILRRHKYPQNKMLLPGYSFLNPVIRDAVMHFTAGQIELMRNLTDYANQRDSWVWEYKTSYYLEPDDAEWDLIQQEVADLEGKLMGNNNVIWGYNDVYNDSVVDTAMPAGISSLNGETVPEGEVWVVTGISAFVVSSTCNQIAVGYVGEVGTTFCDNASPIGSGVVYPFKIDLRLKEGHKAFARFYNMTLNDDAYVYFWGYKMEVPA